MFVASLVSAIGAPPPDTLTSFAIEPDATDDTFTVTVMAG